MRLFLFCLLFSLMPAVQTAHSSPADLAGAAKFPPEKWIRRSINISGSDLTVFLCPKDRCGEKLGATVGRIALPSTGGTTAEDTLRAHRTTADFFKECMALAANSIDPKLRFKIKAIRKLNSIPIGFYAEGIIIDGTEVVSVALSARVKGDLMAIAVAYAPSANKARRSLEYVHLPSLLK